MTDSASNGVDESAPVFPVERLEDLLCVVEWMQLSPDRVRAYPHDVAQDFENFVEDVCQELGVLTDLRPRQLLDFMLLPEGVLGFCLLKTTAQERLLLAHYYFEFANRQYAFLREVLADICHTDSLLEAFQNHYRRKSS